MKRICIAFLLIIALQGCSSSPESTEASTGATGAQPEAVRITPTPEQLQRMKLKLGSPTRRRATVDIPITGQLHLPPQNDARVASVMGGLVHRLNAYIGDQVQAGQVLALLANPEFIRLQEQFLTLRSQLALQQRETQRQQTLVTQQAGVERLLDEARTQEQMLQARLSSTRLQLEQLGADMGELEQGRLQAYLPVRSPITGTVNEVLVQAGQNVASQSPLYTVIDSRHLHMELHIFERDLPRVKTGLAVIVKMEGQQQPLQGRIFSIGRSVDPETRTISLHAEIIGSPTGLVGGQYLKGNLLIPEQEIWTLPSSAVHRWAGAWYAFRLHDQSDKAYIPIRLSPDNYNTDYVEIPSHLSVDSNWVIEGGYSLLGLWQGPQED